jgi:hypothetical protein
MSPLVLGAIFGGGATFMAWLCWRGRRKHDGRYKGASTLCAGICAFIALMCVVFLVFVRGLDLVRYISPSVGIVRSSQPEDVRSIEIREHYSKSMSLRPGTLEIDDPESIHEIMAELAAAKPISPNHPGTQWLCVLAIKTRKGTAFCEVSGTGNQGTLFTIRSSAEGGWVLGEYRNDALGRLLKSKYGE